MKKFLLASFLICCTLFADINTTKKELDFREKITNSYHSFLNNIDCYIADYEDINQSNYKKISKNKLYLIFSFKNSKDNPLQKNLYLKANIRLPQTQKKLEITLSKQTINDMDNQNIDANNERALEDEKLHVGFKYYLYKERYSIIFAKLGFRLHSPFGIYGEFAMQKSYFYHTLQTILESNIYYYINKDYIKASAAITFFKPLSDTYILEQKNEVLLDYESKSRKLKQTLRLYHFINTKTRMQYQLTYASFDDDVCNLCQDWYGANINFHHNVKKWLFFEVIPQVLKRRENSFEFEKIVTINFGITFSK